MREYLDKDAEYFKNSERAIVAHNNRMLNDGCLIYGVVLAFYTLLSLATPQPDILRYMYYAFDLLHVALTLTVFLRSGEQKRDSRLTQLLSGAFIVLILSFFALEGALVSKTEHSLYLPIAILLVQLLFISRPIFSFLSILLYCGGFALLSWLYKSPQAAINDCYIALATYISANIGYVITAKLRRSEQRAILELEEINRIDALTGLYNKSTVEQLCRSRLELSAGGCALIVVDIDDFKLVNDRFGHDSGDEVLKIFGALIKGSFRSSDIAGRFGGDEFIVLMESCGSRETIQNKLLSLQERLDHQRFTAPELAVHCSAGVAMGSYRDDFSALFSRADSALYKAKHQGKNGICFDDEGN